MALAFGLAATNASCQAVAPAVPTAYDVVTVKLNKTASDSSSTDMGRITFQATNVSLKRLIARGYGIREALISGLPPWADDARFDINAKLLDADPNVLKAMTPVQRRALVASLLQERFHLVVHTETKTLPVYDLVVAKGKPKFKPSLPGTANGIGVDASDSNLVLIATAMPISSFAASLSARLDRTVIDKTGLTGNYDLQLKWTADRLAADPDNGQAADSALSVFTAIQEQLGLKLVPAKGPTDTLVVDQATLPTEN
jgi:uncharacterized protein (TIGR03435 family)